MDAGALEGRVVGPGSVVPGWLSDAVSPPAAVALPGAVAGDVLVQPDFMGAVALRAVSSRFALKRMAYTTALPLSLDPA